MEDNKNFIDIEFEKYFEIFENIVVSNTDKKSSQIVELLINLQRSGYIPKEVFNDFFKNGSFQTLITKHLPEEKIDILDITFNL